LDKLGGFLLAAFGLSFDEVLGAAAVGVLLFFTLQG
jgi:hypothetical protein